MVMPEGWEKIGQHTRLVEEDKIKITRDNVKGRYGWEIKISSMDLTVPEAQQNVLEQIRKIDHDLRIMFGTEDSPIQNSGSESVDYKAPEDLEKMVDEVVKPKEKKEKPKDGKVSDS